MKPSSDHSYEISLQDVVGRLYESLNSLPGKPTLEELESACDVLFTTSLLKEEGHVVRARIVIAPPDGFAGIEGPPDGIHAVRFTTRPPLTPNEIKRLSPAAGFFHSMLAIWPDRDRGFIIWGILNTGPRWLNLVGGGRKPMGEDLLFPVIHVRDPGWLLFYNGYDLIAEWRGRVFHGPRMDVFQSGILSNRFAAHRKQLVESLVDCCQSKSLDPSAYAELAQLISLQFVKRIINLVRTSGHGGSLVFLPEVIEGQKDAPNWIDYKYTAITDESGSRFRILIQSLIRRVVELCEDGATAEDAWHVFRYSKDIELDQLEEAFFELARLFADLMQVDGTLVLDKRVRLIGFGGEIRVDQNVFMVGLAQDLEGKSTTPWDVRGDGTRHRSVYRLCSVVPEAIGFVISQDSQVRMIANVDDSVIVWPHTTL